MELRRSPRFPVHCPIVLYRNDTRSEGTMINVSMSGCAVESATRLQRGNYVVLLLHLPDQALPYRSWRWCAGHTNSGSESNSLTYGLRTRSDYTDSSRPSKRGQVTDGSLQGLRTPITTLE